VLRKGFFWFSLVLLIVTTALVGLGAKTLLALRAHNGDLQTMVLPPVSPPTSASRLLIISPHPDDETLGCAGLIRRAKALGASVTVAFVTNGDAFPAGVMQHSGKLRPTPEDYVDFGYARQREALSVLRSLGLSRRNVLFLGYPDRGLDRLWRTNWDAAHPFTALRTACSASPYVTSFRPDTLYCGQSVVRDLVAVLRRTRPTDVYVTHPNDDHGDHWATACFLAAALERMGDEGLRGAEEPRVHTFLVHRGDWPVPQGYRPRQHLVPPSGLNRMDTWWQSLELTPDEEQAKKRAIELYRSQVMIPVERRFMLSFVRATELFGRFDFQPPRDTGLLGPAAPTQPLRIYDPSADKLVRRIDGSADLQLVEAEQQGSDLEIRVRARKSLSRWVRYIVTLRALGRTPRQDGGLVLACTPGGASPDPRVRETCEGQDLHLTVPISLLGAPEWVMLGAETRASGLSVDRSAWKALELPTTRTARR
jgi:LmbE family N-acetylglucosaminyl deacetylase